jgi:hypothetical protein
MQRRSIVFTAAATLVFPFAVLAEDAAHHNADVLKQNSWRSMRLVAAIGSIPTTCRHQNPVPSSPTAL